MRLVNGGEREALCRLTSASPYSSIKISETSLDHLLLGKAADWVIIKLCFAAGKSVLRSGFDFSETGPVSLGNPS